MCSAEYTVVIELAVVNRGLAPLVSLPPCCLPRYYSTVENVEGRIININHPGGAKLDVSKILGL